ncbi:MAG: cell division protein FtsL, partial [Deltaproteobacteria bacterium]|nr:cell division protein FtsL [Deltaproteobacteria bacterium]
IARLAGVCLLAVVFSVIQVWSRIKVLDLRYALTEVQKRIDQMEQQRHRLDLRIAAMTEPERLERVGREVLGLQQPAPGQIVFVREVTDGADLAASTSGQ